jgi:FtsZ-binding cell division protein ZapB
MKYQFIFILLFFGGLANGQTSVFAKGADSTAVFEQLDMHFGAALDTVVVVQFQLNEDGEPTNQEVVRVYCKSCAEDVVKRAKKKALQQIQEADGKALKAKSAVGSHYIVPVTIEHNTQPASKQNRE